MSLKRQPGLRAVFALMLLLSVGALLGSSVVHTHEGEGTPTQCLVCRWSQETVPVLVVGFVLLLSLPDTGRAVTRVPSYRPRPRARRTRSRAPPLV